MTKGSIKETGEEIPDEAWKRFEAAVGVAKDKAHDAAETKTEQPYRDEAQHREGARGDGPRPDDKGNPQRRHDATKTTQRTE